MAYFCIVVNILSKYKNIYKLNVLDKTDYRNGMSEERIIELEIKVAYQEELIESLNRVVARQQDQIGKLEETCKLLYDKIKNLSGSDLIMDRLDETPPHY